MHFMRNLSLCALFGILAPVPAAASDPPSEGGAGPDALEAFEAGQSLLARRGLMGLGGETDFQAEGTVRDGAGVLHARFQQRYRGVPVWGGQAIVHGDGRQPLTDRLVRGLDLSTAPSLGPSEALALATRAMAPRGAFTRPPQATLVIHPRRVLEPATPLALTRGNALDFRERQVDAPLAWHVHLEVEEGTEETRHEDFLIEAHTGEIRDRWSSLQTRSGKALPSLGRTQYSGQVLIGTLLTEDGCILKDPTRANLTTVNLAGGYQEQGDPYVLPAWWIWPSWGDGENYDPAKGSTSRNGQTAGADAQYGMQVTWDFLGHVLGFRGVDGKGRALVSRVHYGIGYDNAFYNPSCDCITFGDGTVFKTFTALVVLGHEMTHAVTHHTADLAYRGESGGLNEATSDIFGTMVTFYAKGAFGTGCRVPDRGGVWTVAGEISTPSYPKPIRYMYKPSLDGHSRDAWSKDLGRVDVHYSSGPMNRAFYFLSQGASADPASDSHSEYLPKGMKGIGNDRATRIWWRTLSTKLTKGSQYVDAFQGALASARELAGPDSEEERAVRNAFAAINVGLPDPPPDPGPEPDGAKW